MILKNKKDVFSELRDCIMQKDVNNNINEVKISSLLNPNIVDEIKTLKIIKLENLESFISYANYDYFLIFKFNDEYYYCDTELVPSLGVFSMIKILDFNLYLRKDKMENLIKNKVN